MTTRRANASNAKALDAYITIKFQIDDLLERLKALSDDDIEGNPFENHWGDVSTLNHYASLLRQISNCAFKEGEHAA